MSARWLPIGTRVILPDGTGFVVDATDGPPANDDLVSGLGVALETFLGDEPEGGEEVPVSVS